MHVNVCGDLVVAESGFSDARYYLTRGLHSPSIETDKKRGLRYTNALG